ncbi:UxaA family hydrolase [Candidatus Poribacteria bacterium]|nr:UxaA family hydrolase [Candidatus Poribacteria bacterium]
MSFKGFLRPDGKVGVRNHVLIVPTIVCANHVSERIAEEVRGAVALEHPLGCGQIGADFEQTVRTLGGMGANPNAGAVLLVSLGCEEVPVDSLRKSISLCKKPVETIVIQELGGTSAAVRKGVQVARALAGKIRGARRERFPISRLTVGLECGGSDATSGIAANPVVGWVADRVVSLGGSVVLSETTEMIGAEHILARRCRSKGVARKLLDFVYSVEQGAIAMGVDIRGAQPGPGNMAGGISTIEEKSLGCVYKAGTSAIEDVLSYGSQIEGKGLFVMDTPGQDVESVSGMLAGGCTIVLFTTGRGTPTGSPIAPVVKITGNPHTWATMKENIDFDASPLFTHGAPLPRLGDALLRVLLRTASGRKTRSEVLGHVEFAITRCGPTI